MVIGSARPVIKDVRHFRTRAWFGRAAAVLAFVSLMATDGRTQARLVIVPNVLGFSYPQAVRILANAGLNVGAVDRQPTNSARPGAVIAQKPEGGVRVPVGMAVSLVMAVAVQAPTLIEPNRLQELMEVPKVVGLPLEQAIDMLKAARLTWRVRPQPGVPIGVLMAQEPQPGTRVPVGTAVTLTVATQELVEVPMVVNRPLEQAMGMLKAARLTWRVRPQPGVAVGTLMAQEPQAGTRVPVGTAVNLVVTTQVLVPNVVGMPPDQARASLERERLRALMRGWPHVPLATTLSQTPLAGTLVAEGTTVSLTEGIETRRWPQLTAITMFLAGGLYSALKTIRTPPAPPPVSALQVNPKWDVGKQVVQRGAARQQGPEVGFRSVVDPGSQTIDAPEDLSTTDEGGGL